MRGLRGCKGIRLRQVGKHPADADEEGEVADEILAHHFGHLPGTKHLQTAGRVYGFGIVNDFGLGIVTKPDEPTQRP